MCDNILAQIDVLIKGRTPVIGIVSYEESRIEAELMALIGNQNAERQKHGDDSKRFVTWSIARGFVEILPEPEDPNSPTVVSCPDPVRAILTAGGILPTPDDRPTIFLLKDIHPYLRSVPQAVRALRDAANALRHSNSTLILVGPTLEIPEDAKKDVRIIDWPLPTPDEIDAQISRFVAKLPSPDLDKLNGNRAKLTRALQGLTRVEADQVLGQAVVTHKVLDGRAIQFSLDAKAQIIRESGALEYIDQKATYADIGGLDLLKTFARRAERAGSLEAKEFGVEPLRGILIVGIPGCGKSLTAKAIAGANRPLLRLDIGALFGSLVGQSEGQTRNALKVTEAVAPCILWIDEIEKGLGGSGGELDGGTKTRVVGTILTWMQESTADVQIVATANDIGSLRPELIRRFDAVFFVDIPTKEEREEIFHIHLSKRNRDPGLFDLSKSIEITEAFTGSEVENVVKAGLLSAFDESRSLTATDLELAALETVPLSTTMASEIVALREWSRKARPASSRQESGNIVAGSTKQPATYLELD